VSEMGHWEVGIWYWGLIWRKVSFGLEEQALEKPTSVQTNNFSDYYYK